MTKKQHHFKILVIGDQGTGKSCLIKRYVYNFYSQHYRTTIGVDFALKIVPMPDDESTEIRLQLWDIAGQARVENLLRVYYKEAVGAFVVFDVTRYFTFESVVNWKQGLDSKVTLPNGTPIPCVLLANKIDLPKDGNLSDPNVITQFAEENGFAKWFETSAKENIGIKDAANFLIRRIVDALQADGPPPLPDDNIADLSASSEGESKEKVKKSKCCSG
ncbi:rab32, member RAS oncoprotein [Cichlidogyrus casuarinus]|uniref:Ras-related protein Rab n=1 Tax=Cichlidogyrus casuarinus TaxID=1844966 RepID=A0ABD2Q0H3_9PLAT